jgi:hypothetical protein
LPGSWNRPAQQPQADRIEPIGCNEGSFQPIIIDYRQGSSRASGNNVLPKRDSTSGQHPDEIREMSDLKINEIPNPRIRQRRLATQRDDGRPTEDDIVREHFGPRGERKDDPNGLPLEANTRGDWPIGWAK